MGIKQAIESLVGTNEPAEDKPVEEKEEPKQKRKRVSSEEKHQERLKLCLELLEETKEDLLEDVDGDVTRIGGARLVKYNELNNVEALLHASLK